MMRTHAPTRHDYTLVSGVFSRLCFSSSSHRSRSTIWQLCKHHISKTSDDDDNDDDY
jgi:hypothetical protein